VIGWLPPCSEPLMVAAGEKEFVAGAVPVIEQPVMRATGTRVAARSARRLRELEENDIDGASVRNANEMCELDAHKKRG
jgi:hypothetical protein